MRQRARRTPQFAGVGRNDISTPQGRSTTSTHTPRTETDTKPAAAEFPNHAAVGTPDAAAINHSFAMHVITRRELNKFALRFPDAKPALADWYRVMRRNAFENFAEVRELFPAADKVGKLTVFNIGGNKYRLIAAIHYNRKRIYIRAVLTHDEYNKGKWKE